MVSSAYAHNAKVPKGYQERKIKPYRAFTLGLAKSFLHEKKTYVPTIDAIAPNKLMN